MPALIQALCDDVHTRNTITESLCSIQVFANTVQQAGKSVMETRGSAKSIEIAQQLIPEKLENIKKCIALVEQVKPTAIKTLEQHYQVFLQIAGPKAADFSSQEAEVFQRMRQLHERKNVILNQDAINIAEVEKYTHLIGASERCLHIANDRIAEESQRRIELASLISGTEARRDEVPETISVTTTSSSSKKKHWFWGGKKQSSSTVTTNVRNPHRQEDQNYYDAIIASRSARLAGIDANEDQKRAAAAQMDAELASYRARYAEAVKRAKDYAASSAAELRTLNAGLEGSAKEIEDIRAQADLIVNKMGLRGSVLLECLAAIREMNSSRQNTAGIFAPLATVLKAIVTDSETSVSLLSGTPNDLFVAGRNLLAQCGHYNSTFIELQSSVIKNAPVARLQA